MNTLTSIRIFTEKQLIREDIQKLWKLSVSLFRLKDLLNYKRLISYFVYMYVL